MYVVRREVYDVSCKMSVRCKLQDITRMYDVRCRMSDAGCEMKVVRSKM